MKTSNKLLMPIRFNSNQQNNAPNFNPSDLSTPLTVNSNLRLSEGCLKFNNQETNVTPIVVPTGGPSTDYRIDFHRDGTCFVFLQFTGNSSGVWIRGRTIMHNGRLACLEANRFTYMIYSLQAW